MSEVIDVEAKKKEEEQPESQDGVINIRLTDNSVKYDTNFSTPELIFWMKVVQEMIIKQVIEGDAKDE